MTQLYGLKDDIHPQFCQHSPLLLFLSSRSVGIWPVFPLPSQSMIDVHVESQGGESGMDSNHPIAGGLYVKEAMSDS